MDQAGDKNNLSGEAGRNMHDHKCQIWHDANKKTGTAAGLLFSQER